MLDRFSPLPLARGLAAKNRLVLPPMASGTGDAAGFVTAQTLAHYERLAAAGTGLAFVEYTYVDASGKSEPEQLGLTTEAHAQGLGQIAALLRAAGSIPGIQLTHAGGKTERAYTGGALMGPSAIPVPVKDRTLEAPTPMDAAAIALWKDSFITAARRAAAAGFAVVELHAAHGYGLSQWLSPLTNARDDRYGGDLPRRAALLLELVAGLRAALPETLLAVRLGGADFLPGGGSVDDAAQVARWLVEAGVELIDVSSGVGGWRRPGDRVGEGYLVPEAEAIQRAVSVPVIGVGGIATGAYIDESLRAGRFSLAAVGRAILADPAAFKATVLAPKATPRPEPLAADHRPSDRPRSKASG